MSISNARLLNTGGRAKVIERSWRNARHRSRGCRASRRSSMRSRSLRRRLSSVGPGIPCVAGRRPGHCRPPRYTPTGPQPCRLFQPGSHRWGVRRRRPVASSASVRPCSQRPAPHGRPGVRARWMSGIRAGTRCGTGPAGRLSGVRSATPCAACQRRRVADRRDSR